MNSIIDTTNFLVVGHRTRAFAEVGKNDITWMPDNITVALYAQSTQRVLLLHEKKPGTVLRFGEGYAPPRPHSLEVDLGTGSPVFLAEDEVITMPSGSVKNSWEGKRDNFDPLVYFETPEQAVRSQLKGETGQFVDTSTLINLQGSFVKPANMPTYDMYFGLILPEEFVPNSDGIDPTIKGGHWTPLQRALELVDAGIINHDPACQALLRFDRYLRKNG